MDELEMEGMLAGGNKGKESGRRKFLIFLSGLPLGLELPRRLYGGKLEKRALPLNVFSVTGHAYYDGPQVEESLQPGEILVLRAELENLYGSFAVEILRKGGAKPGCVPRSDNKAIHRLLRQGAMVIGKVEKVRVEEPSWRRVKVSVWVVA